MKNFDLRKFLSENKFIIRNTNKKSNTTSVKSDTLVESKKIKEAKQKKTESVNEVSLVDKIMRTLFYNDGAYIPAKVGYHYPDDYNYDAKNPYNYKKAVQKMKDIELTNFWDQIRRKTFTFNPNQKFMKKLVKIEMEKRGLKMLPDLGK